MVFYNMSIVKLQQYSHSVFSVKLDFMFSKLLELGNFFEMGTLKFWQPNEVQRFLFIFSSLITLIHILYQITMPS